MERPDMSVVVTFHREGALAWRSLRALRRAVGKAVESGLKVEVIACLDTADAATADHVVRFEMRGMRVISLVEGCPALARNAGVAASRGTFVAVLDGDDYLAAETLVRFHDSLVALGPGVIVHPEFVASFGEVDDFLQQMDQDDPAFSQELLLTYNPWCSMSAAPRGAYLDVPYVEARPQATGFGMEDWHWNCETVARGYRHKVVPGTALFYRRAHAGRHAGSLAVRATMRPSSLFSRAWGEKRVPA